MTTTTLDPMTEAERLFADLPRYIDGDGPLDHEHQMELFKLKDSCAVILGEVRKRGGNVELWAARLQAIRQRLIVANLGLVYRIVQRAAPITDVPKEDLGQEAMIALTNSVDSFKYQRGNRFSTYGYLAIVRRVMLVIRKAKRQLRGYSVEHIDVEAQSAKDLKTADRLAWLNDQLYDALNRNTAKLTPVEALVIRRRLHVPIQTLDAIGKQMGVCRERVRQIQRDAVNKLRKVLVLQ